MSKDSHAPDIRTQFEELLDTVWSAERNWRFDDFLDLAAQTDRAPRRVIETN